VAKRKQVKALIAKTHKRFDRIDTLVNNAGVGLVGPFAETSLKDFRRLMDVNFWGTVHACQAVLPVMAPQGGGVIINVSSILGKRAMPFSAAYSASKFAMRGFSESLRGEVAASGIEVSVVLPGAVQSEFWDEMARPDGFEMPAGVPMLPAAAVAAVIVENARLPQPEVVVGFDAAMLSWFDAVAPLAVDAMMNMAAPFLQRAQGSGQAGS
jgi:short-subunit dehydrogenase